MKLVDMKILSMTGIKGGVGKTAVTVNLATALAMIHPHEFILVIDTDDRINNVAPLFRLSPERTYFNDVLMGEIPHEEAVFPAELEGLRNLLVLPAGRRFVVGEKEEDYRKKTEKMSEIIEEMKDIYRFILFDSQASLSKQDLIYLGVSDALVPIAEPSMASINGVKMSLAVAAFFETDVLGFILNRVSEKREAWIQNAEEQLKCGCLAVIPEDKDLNLAMREEEVPIVWKDPNHKISRIFFDLAYTLSGRRTAQKTASLTEKILEAVRIRGKG